MNTIQLIRQDNGEPVRIWACGKCGHTSEAKGIADSCCAPCETCGGATGRHDMGQCSDCRWKMFDAREKAKLAKQASEAKRDPDWVGWVFSDEYGGGSDGFFDSPEEFMERLNDDIDRDPDLGRPEFVWATVSRPIVNIGVDDVLGLITEDRPESWDEGDLNGVDELKSALAAFNAANTDLMYEPDRTVIVPLDWTKIDQAQVERSPQ